MPDHLVAVAILPGDIDFLGHVNNASYLRWVQEAVLAHWHAQAPAHALVAYRWLALRHEIDYLTPSYLADRLEAHVSLVKVHGARAFFDTDIIRGAETIVRARSVWCSVDADTLRATRIERAIIARFAGRSPDPGLE